MRAMAAVLAFGLVAAAPAAVAAQGRWAIDFENGAAISGYNDARIPGDSGTLFSFTENIQSETEYFWRVRGEVRLTPRQSLSVLAAPLSIARPFAGAKSKCQRYRPDPLRALRAISQRRPMPRLSSSMNFADFHCPPANRYLPSGDTMRPAPTHGRSNVTAGSHRPSGPLKLA